MEYSQFIQKENVFWIPVTSIISSQLRVNRSKVAATVNYQLPKVVIPPDMTEVVDSQQCSFMVYGDTTSWSTAGCQQTNTSVDGAYNCHCNHTTDFAVLLLLTEPNLHFVGNQWALFYMGLFGESLSVLSLLLTIATYAAFKNFLKTDRSVVHLNLMLALLLAHISLVVTQILWVNEVVTKSMWVLCKVLTFIQHWTLLSSIAWMFIEGLILYKKVLIVLSRQAHIVEVKYYFIGWLLPCVISLTTIVICTLAGQPYANDRCWLTRDHGVIWSFAAPVCIVTITNLVILIRVLQVAIRTQRRRFASKVDSHWLQLANESTFQQDVGTVMRGIVVLTPLLGVPWLFGFFVNFHISAAYFFVLVTAFQGFYVMLFYLLMNPEIKLAWKMWRMSRKRKRTLSLADLQSNTSSRNSNQSRMGSFLSNLFGMRMRRQSNLSDVTCKEPMSSGHDFNSYPSRPSSGKSESSQHLHPMVSTNSPTNMLTSRTSVRIETTSSFTPSDQMLLPRDEKLPDSSTNTYVNTCCVVEDATPDQLQQECDVIQAPTTTADIVEDDNDEDWLSVGSEIEEEIIGDDAVDDDIPDHSINDVITLVSAKVETEDEVIPPVCADDIAANDSNEYLTAIESSCDTLDKCEKVDAEDIDVKKGTELGEIPQINTSPPGSSVDLKGPNEIEPDVEDIITDCDVIEEIFHSDKEEDWKSVTSSPTQSIEDLTAPTDVVNLQTLCESTDNLRPQSCSTPVAEPPVKLPKLKTKKAKKKKSSVSTDTAVKTSKSKKTAVNQTKSQVKGNRNKSTSSTSSSNKVKNEVVSVVKRKISQVGMKVTTKKYNKEGEGKKKEKHQTKRQLPQTPSTSTTKQRPKSSEDRTSYLKNKLKTSPAVENTRQVKKAWDADDGDVNVRIYDDSNLRPQSGDSNDSGIAVT